MLKNILLVGFGGFLGSICRYIVYLIFDRKLIDSFPWSTFTVNIVGSLLLGLLAGLILKQHLNESYRLFLAIGFCGSFTTFSTFAYENVQLLQQKPLIALTYIAASVITCLGLAYLGFLCGKEF